MPKRALSERLEDLYYEVEVDHYATDEAVGHEPENGLQVRVRGGDVEMTEWTFTPEPDDSDYKEEWEEAPVLKISTGIPLEDLMEPTAKHRQGYTGDVGLGLEEVLELWETNPKAVEQAIIAAAISYLAYYGGSEEMVEGIGD